MIAAVRLRCHQSEDENKFQREGLRGLQTIMSYRWQLEMQVAGVQCVRVITRDAYNFDTTIIVRSGTVVTTVSSCTTCLPVDHVFHVNNRTCIYLWLSVVKI